LASVILPSFSVMTLSMRGVNILQGPHQLIACKRDKIFVVGLPDFSRFFFRYKYLRREEIDNDGFVLDIFHLLVELIGTLDFEDFVEPCGGLEVSRKLRNFRSNRL
jgi:hypothetical protein